MQNLSAIDTGQGRLVPGVAVDEMARDLLTWFGVSASDMDYVLPSFTSRFGGRPSLDIMGDPAPTTPTPPVTTPPVVTPPAPTTPSTPTSSGGGGGGSLGGWTFAAAGALVALKKIADRKNKVAAVASGPKA
jgi:hypothetical protein